MQSHYFSPCIPSLCHQVEDSTSRIWQIRGLFNEIEWKETKCSIISEYYIIPIITHDFLNFSKRVLRTLP